MQFLHRCPNTYNDYTSVALVNWNIPLLRLSGMCIYVIKYTTPASPIRLEPEQIQQASQRTQPTDSLAFWNSVRINSNSPLMINPHIDLSLPINRTYCQPKYVLAPRCLYQNESRQEQPRSSWNTTYHLLVVNDQDRQIIPGLVIWKHPIHTKHLRGPNIDQEGNNWVKTYAGMTSTNTLATDLSTVSLKTVR